MGERLGMEDAEVIQTAVRPVRELVDRAAKTRYRGV
jgi:hypothetical protein